MTGSLFVRAQTPLLSGRALMQSAAQTSVAWPIGVPEIKNDAVGATKQGASSSLGMSCP